MVGAAGGDLVVQPTANRVLDEADKAHADFLSAGRQLISKGIDADLAAQEPKAPKQLPAVEEVESLNLTREGISTIIWATGYNHDSAG